MKALRGRVARWFAWLLDDADLLAVGRPYDRTAVYRRTWPFAAVAVSAMALIAGSVSPDRSGVFALGALLTGLAIAGAVALPWSRLPTWLDPLPPFVYVVAVAVLRHSVGGENAGIIPLYALAIVWVALYGTRRQVLVIVAAASLAVLAPVVLIGAPDYPGSEWRRAVLHGAIGLLVGLSINGLVARLRKARDDDRRQMDLLAAAKARHQAMITAANDALVTLTPDGRILEVNPAAEAMFRGTRDALVGRDLIATLATAEEQEFLRRGMERITVEQDPTARPRFRTDLVRLDGEAFPAEVSVGVIEDHGRWTVHAFARDITELVQAEHARERELDDLGALLEISRELSQFAGLDTVRTTICSAAMRVSGATAVLLFEPRDGEFVATARAGRDLHVERVAADEPSGIATSFQSGQPFFAGRLEGNPRVSEKAARASGAKAGYWQPIRGRAATAGVLVVVWDRVLEALEPRVERLLNIVASHAEVALELADLVGDLEELALHDGLTGLLNRRTLDQTLIAELDRAKRSGRPLSVVMLDLDHFKAYNDEHGHPAGDALLVAAAQAWLRELRPSDGLARYGGEEFTAVLPDCDHHDALEVAERLRAATPSGATASAGVATALADEGPPALVGRADAALFRAKQSGRNQTIAA